MFRHKGKTEINLLYVKLNIWKVIFTICHIFDGFVAK